MQGLQIRYTQFVILRKPFTKYIPPQIQSVRIQQQSKQQYHTHDLRILQELLTRLTAGNDLVQQEQYMPPVQRRNRQNVHKCQDDG